MSVGFEFTKLPEEIKALVAEETVREILSQSDGFGTSEPELQKLSLISSTFTKPAQAYLFRRIKLRNRTELSDLMKFIKSNSNLAYSTTDQGFKNCIMWQL